MDWVIGIFAAAMFFSLTTVAVIMSHTRHDGDDVDNTASALLARKAKQKKESKKRPALDAERREPFIFRK